MSKQSNLSFHDFELGICGFSGSGKTTLISKLIDSFSKAKFSVGYIKHQAHSFTWDYPGKDTAQATDAGAQTVHIKDNEHWGLAGIGEMPHQLAAQAFIDRDFVLIEGGKEQAWPKLVMVDERLEILPLISGEVGEGQISNICGLIAQDQAQLQILKKIHPTKNIYTRDNVGAIVDFIKVMFANVIEMRPLYGLILAGGQSIRMGEDKSAQVYHDNKTQVQFAYDLAQQFCSNVYISCRPEQHQMPHLRELPCIIDRMLTVGPLGGMISAFETQRNSHKWRNAAWLVLACDLPLLRTQTLEQLVSERDPFKLATCFRNGDKGWYEPLCTIWEPKALTRFYQALMTGNNCPRKILHHSAIKSLDPASARDLDNVNHPEERPRVLAHLLDKERSGWT